MSSIIEIKDLGKKYKLNPSRRYLALRDVITDSAKQLFGKKTAADEFWALQDINIDFTAGERIGIIGRNGAGKSTLLKILSRITPPSVGKARIRGRVASLLEVGTGFHPELTGRENIYLNGAILGLSRKEIRQKLDSIIDFSGVEKFIDTPLKHYSSGMNLRLAFSVAAQLEPEIFLIDEVLAVGDAEFQKKCIGKMEEVSRAHGRTILFVSHNMAAIKQLCTKGLVLENGKNVFFGDINEAQRIYSDQFRQNVGTDSTGSFDLLNHPNKVRKNSGLLNAKILVDGKQSDSFIPGAELTIKAEYFIDSPFVDPEIGIVIKDDNFQSLIGLNNKHLGKKIDLQVGKKSGITINIPSLNIYSPGRYLVDLYFGDQLHFYECLYDALEFTIPPYDIFHSGREPLPEWNKIFIGKMDIHTE